MILRRLQMIAAKWNKIVVGITALVLVLFLRLLFIV
jgi:hypothetical protein